jgi:hypothetical protein
MQYGSAKLPSVAESAYGLGKKIKKRSKDAVMF